MGYNVHKESRFIEMRLKKLKRRDYLEKIIQDGFIKIKTGNVFKI